MRHTITGWDSETFETWHWRCKEGPTGGLVRDWTLNITLSDDPYGLAFTFRVESDNPQDIPLGFEYLIQIYILYTVYDTLELPTSLSEVFKTIQEHIWQFTNAKKVKLAFMTSWSSHAASWRSALEDTKQVLQKEHAAIIAIIEDFMRSRTDVDLDFTIDGLSPKESHLLISGAQINGLLWPIHVQIPWNIQRHILERIPPYVPDENDDLPASNYYYESPVPDIDSPQREACQTLQRCSLVCRQWASVCQQLIFRWIRLASHQQMDKLYTLFIASGFRSSHLVRRLSIVYEPPYEKIGEVIPRIIGMRLSQLGYLDFFSGVRHLVASGIRFGHDKLGDCRPTHRSKEWQTPMKVSCLWDGLDSDDSDSDDLEVYTPPTLCLVKIPILWLTNIPNSHRVIEISSPRTTNPFLTPRIANAIMDILGREMDNFRRATWRWRYGEGRTGGLGRDWTLSCATSEQKFCLYFRFHTRSDQPQDVPLGCEHLVELSIPHVAGHTWDLRVSLLQRFQGLQELLGEFTNLKKIDLALTIKDRKRRMSHYEDEKQRLQKQYTAIIAITEEFICSQTGFDMDFTIDGLTLEELHLLISSVPTNELLWPIHIPIPWNIQRHIIESVPNNGTNSVRAFADLTHDRVAEFQPISTVRDQIGACQTLRTCSLVCRQWASISRKLIFHWICLSNHRQTDKLHSLLRNPQSSHLSQLVRRLSIVYHSPYKKIGEAIPRIIGMGLSRLECLDLCAGEGTGEFDFPTFPFHPSLRAQLSQLNQVRILHLHNFRFSHLAEFRRFVCAFSGIQHLIAIFVDFGRDKLGEYRPIHCSKEWQMPAKISWLSIPWSLWRETHHGVHDAIYTPSILWLKNVPNSHRVIKFEAPCSRTTCPTLTPDVANAIMHTMHYYSIRRKNYPLITWRWRCEEGTRSTDGLGHDWTLICISSYEYQDHYFRFRMRSDNPPDTPLGFEHLIEPCISHLMTEPRELLASLRQSFRASQEKFGGFPNVERVKLTLLTQDGQINAAPWRLQPEETKRMLQERYIPIIPIVEQFGRSQTDFQLDINIDGFPPEELSLLISDGQTTESSDDRRIVTIRDTTPDSDIPRIVVF
ncbi:hypothetical protein NLI96_g11786 [Meripilus lineatus]|uniref:F-box domain-containing protein n=1 Tax=Meripilus lineatus TaxID=2056292 RepID=A0AAD5UR45_9APHY|nr:hypothetical protein NLI96_g11786 [Physisporinus lineatus]